MAEVLSASAKKRLAKKARDARAADEAAPEAAPAPKAAAKAEPAKAKSAAAPKGAAKAEAAPAKVAAKAEPAQAKSAAAAPKQAAKAASAEPFCASCGTQFQAGANFCNNCGAKRPSAAAKASPKVAAAAEPKAKAESKAKSKNPPKEPVVAAKPVENIMTFSFDDDGTGGWDEVSTQKDKKKDKQKEKQDKKAEEERAAAAEEGKAAKAANAGPKAKGGAKKEAPQEKKIDMTGMSEAQKMIAKLEADAAAKAKKEIEAKALAAAAKGAGKGKDGEEGAAQEVNPNWVSAQVTVPSEKMGRIIGPQGKTLQMITEKTGVGKIDTQGDIVTIIGDPEPVKMCEVAIREMVDKGFMSLAYENFTEESVMVHPENFPNIIGQRGAIIRKLKEELSVEINIPGNITKDANGKYGKKKYPVQLAGSATGVAKAKEVINDIVYFKHHPITHPEKHHTEMEVPDWAHRFIIGPKGSEMRHIQNSFKVDVNIPRDGHQDTGACPNVLIVGTEDGVASAKAHIEKLIHNAENDKKSTKREDAAADDERNKGGDEVDAQAAAYLVKRKQ